MHACTSRHWLVIRSDGWHMKSLVQLEKQHELQIETSWRMQEANAQLADPA